MATTTMVARLAGGLLALRARGWSLAASAPTPRIWNGSASSFSAAAPAAVEDASALAAAIARGDRGALSRAITLCESTHPDHSKQAGLLLKALIERRSGSGAGSGAGGSRDSGRRRPREPPDDATPQPPPPPPPLLSSLRVAISGPPGAGKSSLIEALGCALADAGGRVAVLAVDPSSPASGGAVLGDRTRMPRLSAHPCAFVRASPARGALGGVARATADACELCEAAGYGTVLLETVGVGQSEVDAADVADAVVLVLPPNGAGDELQAMKRGLMEVVDVVAVNKADDAGGGERAAQRTAAELKAALAAAPPGAWGVARWRNWRPRVLAVSARTGKGMDELMAALREFRESVGAVAGGGGCDDRGELAARRAAGRERLAWLALEEACLDALRADEGVKAAMRARMAEVRRGEVPARQAADEAVGALFRRRRTREVGGGGGEGS
jgi:LAO/AO transport system kinase